MILDDNEMSSAVDVTITVAVLFSDSCLVSSAFGSTITVAVLLGDSCLSSSAALAMMRVTYSSTDKIKMKQK